MNDRRLHAARGNCYQTAFVLLDLYSNHYVRLVHGIVKRTGGAGEWMGHAWLEFETRGGSRFVIDPQYPADPIPRDEYYAAGRVCYSVDYSTDKARKMHLSRFKTLPFGPWDARIAAAAHADDVTGDARARAIAADVDAAARRGDLDERKLAEIRDNHPRAEAICICPLLGYSDACPVHNAEAIR